MGERGDHRSIPVRAMSDTRLNATDFRTLMAVDLHDRRGVGGRGCVASRATLGDEIGAHPETVAASLRKLAKLGYLDAEEGKNNAKEYRVVFETATADRLSPDAKPQPIDCPSHSGSAVHNEGRNQGSLRLKNESSTSKMGRADAQPSPDVHFANDEVEGNVVSLESPSPVASTACSAGLSAGGEVEPTLASTLRVARSRGVTEQDIQRAFVLGQWDESIGGDREITTIGELECAILDVENVMEALDA